MRCLKDLVIQDRVISSKSGQSSRFWVTRLMRKAIFWSFYFGIYESNEKIANFWFETLARNSSHRRESEPEPYTIWL